MKKTIIISAILTVLAAVSILSACTKTNDMPSDKEVTVTILPPDNGTATRVETIDGRSGISIAGWKTGDQVNLYRQEGSELSDAAVFTCTDAANGTFSGTLPRSVQSVDELNLAATGLVTMESGQLFLWPLKKASEDISDVILMSAFKNEDGTFTMNVMGNILKIINNRREDICGALKLWNGYDYNLWVNCGYRWEGRMRTWRETSDGSLRSFSDYSFTIAKSGVTYVFLTTNQGGNRFGISTEQDGNNNTNCSVVPFKETDAESGIIYVYELNDVVPTDIVLNYSSLVLEVGQTQQLQATLLPGGTVPVEPFWSSGDHDVATVDDNGMVTAIAAGSTTIRVSTSDGYRLNAECTVTVTEPAPPAKHLCYLYNNNYGNIFLLVDGVRYSPSTAVLNGGLTVDGSDIYYYIWDDGFYKNGTKVADFRKEDKGSAVFHNFTVKNGVIYLLLIQDNPDYARVMTIDIKTGTRNEVQLNTIPYSDLASAANEDSIRVTDDGTIYVLGMTRDGAGHYSSKMWIVHPGDPMTVEEHLFFQGTDDVSTYICDLETGDDNSVYALVSFKSKSENVSRMILYKNFTEIRRYNGYFDGGYYPRSLSIDGEDIYAMLKRDGEWTADIFKNGAKVKEGLTDCRSGCIVGDGNGGYYYAITYDSHFSSNVYHNDELLYSHDGAMAYRIALTK